MPIPFKSRYKVKTQQQRGELSLERMYTVVQKKRANFGGL